MAEQYRRRVNRPLRPDEDVLVRWLVAHGEPEAKDYAEQIDRIRVSSECTCGCPSINFELQGTPRPNVDEWLVIADVAGDSPEGIKINVMLHANAGALYELEIFSADGRTHFGLPRLEDLKLWEDAAV